MKKLPIYRVESRYPIFSGQLVDNRIACHQGAVFRPCAQQVKTSEHMQDVSSALSEMTL
jgi:hypothetical protein